MIWIPEKQDIYETGLCHRVRADLRFIAVQQAVHTTIDQDDPVNCQVFDQGLVALQQRPHTGLVETSEGHFLVLDFAESLGQIEFREILVPTPVSAVMPTSVPLRFKASCWSPRNEKLKFARWTCLPSPCNSK
jgi:hypothetical protein